MVEWRDEAERATSRLMQLVDESGRTVGEASPTVAHAPPGRLHRGFSVFLVDDSARLLIQRRSAVRMHSAGLWASSCCGHPSPGESPFDSAWRRLGEEMGVEAFGLNEVGIAYYRLPVPGLTRDDRLVECEWNHVFVGKTLNAPSPDPLAVVEYRFVLLAEMDTALERFPFAPWIPATWRVAGPYLAMITGASRKGPATATPRTTQPDSPWHPKT